MISTIVSRLVILVFGTLYPAYASYKAVRTKNVKEYVKWMMYWIVFALFTCAETFTDVFLSWFPFYYEIKIILVLWLLSPATKGSSILYRKFVHPMLSRREQEIDDYIAKAKEQGYHTVLNLGTKGVNYATTVIMQTAIKGGGGLVNQLRKSYSLSDLTDNPDTRADTRGLPEHLDDGSDVIDARHHRRKHSPRRSASGSSRVDMYFPEVDIRQGPILSHGSHVRSTEDVSSGYSSAEPLYIGQPPKLEAREGLVRTASVGGSSTRSRTRVAKAAVSSTKKTTTTTVPEDSEESESETESSEITIIRSMPKLLQVSKFSQNSNSSEESDNADFMDTIGFPAENVPQKMKEIGDISPEKLIIDTIQPLDENITKVDISSSTIINNENVETVRNVEIQIKQQPSTNIFENTSESLQTKSSEDKIRNKDEMETVCNVEIQIEKQPSLEIVEDTSPLQTKPSEVKNSNENEQQLKEENIPKNETKPELDDTKINEEKIESQEKLNKNEEFEDNGDYETLSLSSVSPRGGKYNKHTAPIPPSHTEKQDIESASAISNISCGFEKNLTQPEVTKAISEHEDDKSSLSEISSQNYPIETHPIKATLVLKPGIIKSIGPPTEDLSKTQIFVSQSPKSKRKSKSKSDSPISRLMMLPKKFFGHKESGHSSNEDLKRKSWHEDTRSLTPSSIEDVKISKSDTEDSYEQLIVKNENKSNSAISIAKTHEENKILLRTLSHSPKQYRRRTREERKNDYEDSD